MKLPIIQIPYTVILRHGGDKKKLNKGNVIF